MNGVTSLLQKLKQYIFAFRVAASLFALLTLHLVALREFLLGPLSSLTDSVFFIDATLDLFVAVILATLAARLVFLTFLTGFGDDNFTTVSRIVRVAYKLMPKNFPRLDLDYKVFVKEASDRLPFIEAATTVFFFSLIYFGSFFSLFSTAILFLGLFFVAILLAQILFNADLHPIRDVASGKVLTEPKKLGLLFVVLTSLLFLASICLAYVRASEIYGSNVAAVKFVGQDDTVCATVLGKSSGGLFLHALYGDPSSLPNRTFFVPLDKIENLVAMGGSEFYFLRNYEDLNCGADGIF